MYAIRSYYGAWNRGGGEGEDVHFGAKFFQTFFMGDPEPLFFIDDHQAEIAKMNIPLQQVV